MGVERRWGREQEERKEGNCGRNVKQMKKNN